MIHTVMTTGMMTISCGATTLGATSRQNTMTTSTIPILTTTFLDMTTFSCLVTTTITMALLEVVVKDEAREEVKVASVARMENQPSIARRPRKKSAEKVAESSTTTNAKMMTTIQARTTFGSLMMVSIVRGTCLWIHGCCHELFLTVTSLFFLDERDYSDHVTDDFQLDDTYFFSPRPVATIWGEAFSPQTSIPPVYPNPLVPSSSDVGTVYLYTNWTTNVQDIDMFEIPVYVDGEEVIIWISLDGYCTRFGTPENSAQGYCHFTYTVYDPESLLISGSFAAEGFLVDASRPGEFTIVGGTGILTGASGIVEVSPASLDSVMTPPLVVSPPAGADIFDGLAGYVHYFEVQADLFFFLPDLYYTGNGGSDEGYYH